MLHDIVSAPTYSAVECHLDAGESIVGDSGAMAWMTDSIQTQTSTRGGLLQGLKRKLLAGESFFQNTYTAENGPGTIAFAPGAAGDIQTYELSNSELILERGAFLASQQGVNCDSKWDGFRGLLNEGMFLLRVGGSGTLFFHSYGSLEVVDVESEYIVDNGYAVAWEPTLEYQLTRGRKIRSFLFSDQLLLRFSGRGRLWIQSRSAQTLAEWVYPFRGVESKNDDD
ncbi:MAG: TIGR00266 family protein [Planctomycetaceae bacterium]